MKKLRAQLLARMELRVLWMLMVGVFFVGIMVLVIANGPTRRFPTGATITIEKGSSARSVVQQLESEHVIGSRTLALGIAKATGIMNTMVAGEYQFSQPLSTWAVLHRIGNGKFGIDQVRVTLLEGWTNQQYADALEKELPNFDSNRFANLTNGLQGYLFPDTYFYKKTDSTDVVVKKMQDAFDSRTEDLPAPTGRAIGRSREDIIIMASILEGEATNYEDARMISDILWSRIDAGMPLQVDATLKYTTGRGSAQLTINDLRTDSPYNTYTRRGLPPGAIGNPGIEMIHAALLPSENNYMYYLHDSNGQPFYARTHDEHVYNKRVHLK